MTDKPSPEWSKESVVARLQRNTGPGRPNSAQVFLAGDVPPSALPDKAREIVEAAVTSLDLPPGAVRIGKIHRLANSFSVTTDSPRVFDAIARRSDVTSILESEQADILPKPQRGRPVR